MRSYFQKMSELKKTTWKAALAIGAALLLVFICIFRTSNVTTLVIVMNFAVLAVFSMVTSSRWRYLMVPFLTGVLALELAIYHEGNPAGVNGLFYLSVLSRFFISGLIIMYFATLLTRASHNLYYDMQRLAAERQEALDVRQRLLARLNALLTVITTLSTRNRLQEILKEGLEETRSVFNADSGLIYRVGRQTGRLTIMSSFGYSPELLEKMKERGISYATSCRACVKRRPYSVDNLADDPDKCQNLAKVRSGSSICLPIASEERVWGVLHLRRRFPDAFTEEDVQLAQAIAYQFALAMQRAYLFDEVDLLSITDPMTELYNYRKLMRDLDREIVRSKRYDHRFSFIMADIDHFKDLNDTYGHPAGDAVLRELARTLDSARREVDRHYRYGGEEFSILLPETGGGEAREVAEKMRRRVEEMEVVAEGLEDPLKATISMGVASYPDDADDLEHIIEAADEALYRAKSEGRNRVASFNEVKEGGRTEAGSAG